MDVQEMIRRTDVTAIGYGVGDLERMLNDPIPIERVCVDGLDTLQASFYDKRISTVVGFPFGDVKTKDMETAIINGAHEIDFPIPVRMVHTSSVARPGCLISPVSFREWVRALELPNSPRTVYKVILHTDLFQKIHGDQAISLILSYASDIANRFPTHSKSGRLVMKTCTGYGPGGADPKVVEALKKEGYRVKASGRIRSKGDVKILVDAGADLLGIGCPAYRDIFLGWGS